MIVRLSILFCLLAFNVSAQSITDIREHFHAAVEDPQQSKAFHQFVSSIDSSSPTVKAYRAASEAMLARVMWNPLSKLGQVRKYATLIDEAVESDDDNIEIRFLRLSVEYNIPRFLGMSSHLEEDTRMIVNNLRYVPSLNIDPDHGHYIISFLEVSGLCTEQEMLAMQMSVSQGAPDDVGR